MYFSHWPFHICNGLDMWEKGFASPFHHLKSSHGLYVLTCHSDLIRDCKKSWHCSSDIGVGVSFQSGSDLLGSLSKCNCSGYPHFSIPLPWWSACPFRVTFLWWMWQWVGDGKHTRHEKQLPSQSVPLFLSLGYLKTIFSLSDIFWKWHAYLFLLMSGFCGAFSFWF